MIGRPAAGCRRLPAFLSGSWPLEWASGGAEPSTREPIDCCSMAIRPLDYVEAIVGS